MRTSFAAVALVLALAPAPVRAALPIATNVYETPVEAQPRTELDKIVFNRLATLNLHPHRCSDAVFVRRAYLDLLGTIPTAKEARAFIEDSAVDKREKLIEEILERSEYADYWSMKWGDILRIKAEFPVNLWPNAAQAYHHWVKESIAGNKPYDTFVRELLTSSGSNFRVGPVNFYRAVQNRTPEGIARVVALTFMGTRADAWDTNRLAGMTAFFSQIGYKPTSEWKEEHVFWDPLGSSRTPGSVAPGRAAVASIANPTNFAATPSPTAVHKIETAATFPDGTRIELPPDKDPREVFADWLIRPENPWFTRAIVNRVWAWLLGRGIIHEPDDIRDDNPPSNPALLAYLEKEMVLGHYDMKQLLKLIVNSEAYQLSSMACSRGADAQPGFAAYTLRRLDAEVLIDAINKVTGASDLYTSPIPEPFTYIPKGVPAVAIADGSISSPFLALFGRSARATGMENERNNKPTPAQALYLLNSTDVQKKLEQGTNIQAVIGFGSRNQGTILEELYLTILSRFPTEDEIKAIEAYTRPPVPKPTNTATNLVNAGSVTNLAPGATNAISTNLGTVVVSYSSNADSNTLASTVLKTNFTDSTNSAPRRGRPIGSLGPRNRAASRDAATKSREDWIDVAWSLINSEEFLYRH